LADPRLPLRVQKTCFQPPGAVLTRTRDGACRSPRSAFDMISTRMTSGTSQCFCVTSSEPARGIPIVPWTWALRYPANMLVHAGVAIGAEVMERQPNKSVKKSQDRPRRPFPQVVARAHPHATFCGCGRIATRLKIINLMSADPRSNLCPFPANCALQGVLMNDACTTIAQCRND
jgi:hypothetical protein